MHHKIVANCFTRNKKFIHNQPVEKIVAKNVTLKTETKGNKINA